MQKELEAGAWKGVARPAGDGSYRVDAAGLARPGNHELVFTVQAGSALDLLPATLVLRPFNSDTLAVVAYQLARDERLGEAALPSLAIVVVGLLPVLLLFLTVVPLMADWPLVPRTMVVTVLVVLIMTWGVAPQLTRWLRPWR